MRRALCLALLSFWAASAAGVESSSALTARQEQARKQQTELRGRIAEIQRKIDAQEASRKSAADELEESESAISAINLRLAELENQQHEGEKRLADLQGQTREQNALLGQRQEELADQLRAQYASGLSPWQALLSGDDPRTIGRDLGYLGYISQSQANTVREIRVALDKLDTLKAQTQGQQKALSGIMAEHTKQREALQRQQQEREQVYARIEEALAAQRKQAQTLEANEQRLGDLITGLEDAIAKQLEAERIAEEKRKAELARQQEAARKAAEARRLELERQREAALLAQRKAREAQEKAQREQDQKRAEEARRQVEQARLQARQAEQAAREQAEIDRAAAEKARKEREREQTYTGSVVGAGAEVAPAPPPGGFSGLKKGLPFPVGGEVQGRFGAKRPDGGTWRGVVLRAGEGAPVRAIAPGRVVYASWLSGFGNIIIVDHGAKYLSVYAYNQSLLRRVGDVVNAGDTIATVGATGGQVESGLYFEIRHQGTPVNPLLWLAG